MHLPPILTDGGKTGRQQVCHPKKEQSQRGAGASKPADSSDRPLVAQRQEIEPSADKGDKHDYDQDGLCRPIPCRAEDVDDGRERQAAGKKP